MCKLKIRRQEIYYKDLKMIKFKYWCLFLIFYNVATAKDFDYVVNYFLPTNNVVEWRIYIPQINQDILFLTIATVPQEVIWIQENAYYVLILIWIASKHENWM